MKCPLLHSAWFAQGRERKTGFDDCLKEECAWWDKPSARCSILQGAMELGDIAYNLKEIRAKMPHENQFRR